MTLGRAAAFSYKQFSRGTKMRTVSQRAPGGWRMSAAALKRGLGNHQGIHCILPKVNLLPAPSPYFMHGNLGHWEHKKIKFSEPVSNLLCSWLRHVQLFVTPWTVAHQAPLSSCFQENIYLLLPSSSQFLPASPSLRHINHLSQHLRY